MIFLRGRNRKRQLGTNNIACVIGLGGSDFFEIAFDNIDFLISD